MFWKKIDLIMMILAGIIDYQICKQHLVYLNLID